MKYPPLVFLVIAVCVISLISIAVTVADKIRAGRGVWRVPEATLLILAALGGSGAMYLTMHLIRHKTRHTKFMRGIPIMMLFQLTALCWLLFSLGVF